MEREKALAKNTIIIGFGTFLPKVASIITLPIVTGSLTKAEYGTYDLLLTLISLVLPLATLQIQTAAFRFLVQMCQVEIILGLQELHRAFGLMIFCRHMKRCLQRVLRIASTPVR